MRHRVEAYRNEEAAVLGVLVRGKIATRYKTRHHFEVFDVGDLVNVGIPGEDRAKTDNKRLYCCIITKSQPEPS